MGAKPKPVDRTGYLANLIYEIVEGIRAPKHYHEKGETKWAVFALNGGASLWWHADTRQIMALRSNAPLQLGEEATFKAHIQKAGYSFKAGIKAGTPVFIDGDLNAWRGVVWVLADVPAGVGEV